MTEYDKLFQEWGSEVSVSAIIGRPERFIVAAGENEIHARGFYSDLRDLALSVGDRRWWLLDLDGGRRSIEFDESDNEDRYFDKLQAAPEWEPGLPFPYAVRMQCFLGDSGWLVLSDRDDERMFVILKENCFSRAVGVARKLIGAG